MCGIAASIDTQQRGRATPWALHLLRHRGPDGAGAFADDAGNVSLEHCRLAIIDPENVDANQPFSDPSGRWTIVYNGEIFNFHEIRRELERAGVTFRTRSDTEVLLLGFIHRGETILERLRGMFAFVIWDKATGDVFAARDQVGVKPLYYILEDGLFIACSEVRPLLSYPGRTAAFDPAGVVDFLAFGDNPGDRTLIEGIRKLLPGHFIRIRNGRASLTEYWDAIPPDSFVASPTATDDGLLRQLDDAVAASLVSDVPLGLMLSGGIDSSAIAALATRHVAPEELTAYSVGFGRPDDESRSAARFAHDLRISHRSVLVTESEVRDEFDSWLDDLDYPAGNPTWIALSFIARAAQADGIKVLLSGDGGDEVFGGYNRWMKYLRFHDLLWKRVPSKGRRVVGTSVGRWTRGLAGDISRRAATGNGLFVPSRPFHDDLLSRCLGPLGRDAWVQHPPERTVEFLRRRFDDRLPGADYLAWMSYVSLKTKIVEDFLQRLDKMGMRHSVEGRVPLLDPDLVRSAMRMPQGLKVPRYRQKALLRDAVSPVLPPYVLERPKQGFCPPVVAWCESLLRSRSRGDDSALFDAGLLSRDGVSTLSSNGSGAAFATWTLEILVEWSRHNLPSAGVADLEVAA